MLSTFEKLASESPFWALLIVFWVGALASLSSCTVVRLPVVIGYVAGSGRSKRRALLLTCLFSLGLVISYTLLGAVTAFTGGVMHRILHANKYVFWILGLVLILAGLGICGVLRLHGGGKRCGEVSQKLGKTGLLGSLLVGVLFGLLVIPACPSCGAGLLVLSAIVVANNLSWYGLFAFISFALGQSLPVLAVGVLTTLAKPDLIRRVRSKMCSVEERIQLLAGNVLIVLGVYFIIVG